MSWLLDSSVISELVRPRPDPGVRAWFEAREAQEPQLYLAALTLAEIWRGVLRMDRQSPRFARLQAWVQSDLPTRFSGRVLAFDEPVARTWGRLTSALPRGASPATMESLIAATAVHHGLVLVTRNVADLRHFPELALESPSR